MPRKRHAAMATAALCDAPMREVYDKFDYAKF